MFSFKNNAFLFLRLTLWWSPYQNKGERTKTLVYRQNIPTEMRSLTRQLTTEVSVGFLVEKAKIKSLLEHIWVELIFVLMRPLFIGLCMPNCRLGIGIGRKSVQSPKPSCNIRWVNSRSSRKSLINLQIFDRICESLKVWSEHLRTGLLRLIWYVISSIKLNVIGKLHAWALSDITKYVIYYRIRQ